MFTATAPPEIINFPPATDIIGEIVGSISSGALVVQGGESTEVDDRNSATNRWPREETLALLSIRSDLDLAFRDSVLKAPLWEQVSRTLAESAGFNRTPKKCKEKFENIYKYHRRTKEGRSGRPNGKNYRFFDQLQAFDIRSPENPPTTEMTKVVESDRGSERVCNPRFDHDSLNCTNDRDLDLSCRRKKKSKLLGFVDRLMNEVIEKQGDMQRRLSEAVEKCERERLEKEAEWRKTEREQMEREQEILREERTMTAAKDAAVLNFIQRISNGSEKIRSWKVEALIKLKADLLSATQKSACW